jgi:hypothetical protein
MNSQNIKSEIIAFFRFSVKSVFFKWILFVVSLVVLFHLTFQSILSNYSSFGLKHVFEGKTDNNDDNIIICHENWNTPFSDFQFSELYKRFPSNWIINEYGINTTNPVFCVARSTSRSFSSKQINGSIVVIGGSIPFGEGIPEGYAFPEIIEKISKDEAGVNLNVINMSDLNESIPDHYNVFSSIVSSFLKTKTKPRTILFIWSIADTFYVDKSPQNYFYMNGPFDKYNYFANVYSWPLIGLFNGIIMSIHNETEFVNNYRNMFGPANKEEIGTLNSYFLKMKREATSAGFDFRVAMFPILLGKPGHYVFQDIHNTMLQLLNNEGIDAVDLTPYVINKPAKELWLYPYDMRPNAEAHISAAKALVNFLNLGTAYNLSDTNIGAFKIRSDDIQNDKYTTTKEYPFCFFIFLLLIFLLAIFTISLIINIPSFIRTVISSNVYVNLAVILILFFALILRIWLSPHMHLVLGNEYDRMRVIELWLANKFGADTFNDFPGAMMAYYPLFLIFGFSSQICFQISAAMSFVSCIIFFAISKMLFRKDIPALLALLLFATYPVNLRFAATFEPGVSNLMFMLFCFYGLLNNIHKRNLSSFVFFMSSISFFIFILKQNIPFAVFLIIFWSYIVTYGHYNKMKYSHFQKFFKCIYCAFAKNKYYIIPALIFFISFATCIALYYISSTGVYSRHVEHYYFLENFSQNIIFFLSSRYLQLTYTILSVFGLYSYRKQGYVFNRMRLAPLLCVFWILIYFSCYIFTVKDMFLSNSETPRHTLDFTAPLFILVAMGIHGLYSMLSGRVMKGVFIGTIIFEIMFIPYVYSNEIRTKKILPNIVQSVLTAASWRTHKVMFLTNTFLFYDALDIDLHANVRLIKENRKYIGYCGKEIECVFLLYHENTFLNLHYQYDNNVDIKYICPDSLSYYYYTVAICPYDKYNKIPKVYFKRPEFEINGGTYYINLPNQNMKLIRNDSLHL